MKQPWLFPSVLVTVFVYVFGLCLLPASGLGAALPIWKFLAGWLVLMCAVGFTGYMSLAIKFTAQGMDRPVAGIVQHARDNKADLATTAIGLGLTGLMSMGFSWVKSQLNYAAPFWADPLWADMDRSIFGADPYIPLRAHLGSSINFVDYVYSLWYPATILSLTGVFFLRKSCSIVAYFLTWGFFGLTVQTIGASAGPIFWNRIGLGHRFDLVTSGVPRESEFASNYLWHVYTEKSNAVAAGISAMPSMHVAMAAWIAIAYMRTRFAPVGVAYWVIVFIGSVALGWHYFMDGVIGTLCAIASFAIASIWLSALSNRAKPLTLPVSANG